jgi:ATPase subunit of ABC transporter with duplicated ATPase domains
MLQHFDGTLIAVSHDPELLRTCVEMLWHIEGGKVHVFSGSYDDYMRERYQKRSAITQELSSLERDKKETHNALMKEQTRAKNAKIRGKKHIEQRKWPTLTSPTKVGRGNATSAQNKLAIRLRKQALTDQLSDLRLPEILTPTFALAAADIGSRSVVSIVDGVCGYGGKAVLQDIHLQIGPRDRIALTGDNGSGKTTLLRAILGDPSVQTSGTWYVPKPEDLGYLDQHYGTLDPQKTVRETLQVLRPDWTHAEMRRHLNDFLFRKNEEVNARVKTLSGGEKARLSLAQIAARTPRLLILDEVTNNLDLETRNYVIQVLQQYPGALLVVSHDEDFLEALNMTKWVRTGEGAVS